MIRRTYCRFTPRKVKDTEALISFILERHSVGLLVLCGDEEWPSTSDFAEMASISSGEPDIRVQGGTSIPEAQRIIEKAEYYQRAVQNAGGQDRIVEIFRDLRASDSRDWRILRDSSMVRRGRPYTTADYTARTIARRHHIHEDTLRRNRVYIIHKLAFEICYPGLAYMKCIPEAV